MREALIFGLENARQPGSNWGRSRANHEELFRHGHLELALRGAGGAAGTLFHVMLAA